MNEQTTASDDFETAYAGAIDFLPLEGDTPVTTPSVREHRQSQLRANLNDGLYGPVPPPPDNINVSRQPIAGERAERLLIEITVDGRRFLRWKGDDVTLIRTPSGL